MKTNSKRISNIGQVIINIEGMKIGARWIAAFCGNDRHHAGLDGLSIPFEGGNHPGKKFSQIPDLGMDEEENRFYVLF